jgi:hypothetical protein
MKYLSIDTETSGLSFDNCQLLSFGGILEDTKTKLPLGECPKINVYIASKNISGEPFALNMNASIIKAISEFNLLNRTEEKVKFGNDHNCVFLTADDFPYYFYLWLLVEHEGHSIYKEYLEPERWYKTAASSIIKVTELMSKHKKIYLTPAGKNFSTFDKNFIDPLLLNISRSGEIIKFRSRVLDPAILYVDWSKDDALPGLSTCKERAGLDPLVTHDALDDAWDVIELLRKKY